MVGVSFFGSEEKIDWVIPDNLLALNPGKEGLDDASGMVLVLTVLVVRTALTVLVPLNGMAASDGDCQCGGPASV